MASSATLCSVPAPQERAEAARHAAAEAAAAAAAEAAALKAALHAALRRAAELDDAEQAVQAGLEARLQEQGALAEQLRCARVWWDSSWAGTPGRAAAGMEYGSLAASAASTVPVRAPKRNCAAPLSSHRAAPAPLELPRRLLSKRLASLRGAGPSSQGSSAADPASSPAELQHQLEMQQKREASEELQRRLLARGLGHGTLAALCSDAEHSAVAGGAAPSAQHKDAAEGELGGVAALRWQFGREAGTVVQLQQAQHCRGTRRVLVDSQHVLHAWPGVPCPRLLPAGPRKGSWMGGGGGGGGGGLLGNFSFRRRGS